MSSHSVADPCSPAGSSTVSPKPTFTRRTCGLLRRWRPARLSPQASRAGVCAAAAAGGTQSRCHSTLAHATRQGILVTLLFFAWALIHYLLASAGIAKSLKAAALRNLAAQDRVSAATADVASSVQSDSI